jgi:hypothetical protein
MNLFTNIPKGDGILCVGQPNFPIIEGDVKMKKVTMTSLFAVVLSISIIGSSSAAFASPTSVNANAASDTTWTQSTKVVSGDEEIGELNTTYQ